MGVSKSWILNLQISEPLYGDVFLQTIRMLHWHHMMVDGTKFWISYQQPAFISISSCWQLIQNSVPSTIVWCQYDIRIISINIFSRYVDKNRLAAVSTGADLKADISHGRFGRRMEGEFQLGDPDDKVLFMSFYPDFIQI